MNDSKLANLSIELAAHPLLDGGSRRLISGKGAR